MMEIDGTTLMLLCGLLAAIVAILATLAIERFGGRVGGVIASVPTTILPASVGMYWEETEAEFIWSMAIVPMGMLVNAFFLWLWRIIPPRLSMEGFGVRLWAMIGMALFGWSIAAALGLAFFDWGRDVGFSPLILGVGTTIAMLSFGVAACLRNPPAPRGHTSIPGLVLVVRGLLAGICIVFSIWLSGLGSPLLSGMASVFPAIFLTTMVALWFSQGEAVQAGAVGPMMLGGTSVSVFTLFAALLFPRLSLWVAVPLVWLGSVILVSLPAYLWLSRRTHP